MNSLIRWEKYADPLRFSLEYFPWKCSNWSERVMHQRSKSFAFGSWLLKLLGSKRNLSGNSIWTNYISARICKNFVILTLIIMSLGLYRTSLSCPEVRQIFKVQTHQKPDVFLPGRRTFITWKNGTKIQKKI